jgi:hypothetical protein
MFMLLSCDADKVVDFPGHIFVARRTSMAGSMKQLLGEKPLMFEAVHL